jgi:hypothetical protein
MNQTRDEHEAKPLPAILIRHQGVDRSLHIHKPDAEKGRGNAESRASKGSGASQDFWKPYGSSRRDPSVVYGFKLPFRFRYWRGSWECQNLDSRAFSGFLDKLDAVLKRKK